MKIFRYEMTDSTNRRAREYALCEFAELPAVFIADGQSDGYGRMGRKFDSEQGAGLYISFLFRPDEICGDAHQLTVRAAVAVARAIEKTCGLSARIKWVNDIVSDGKKLAGILAEGEFDSQGNLDYAVLGIGVNLYSRKFPSEISDIAVAIEDKTGKSPNREALIDTIIEELFCECDWQTVIKEYRRRSSLIGKKITVHRMSGESFFATALDITDSGALLVIRDDGVREELISAEVSLSVLPENTAK